MEDAKEKEPLVENKLFALSLLTIGAVFMLIGLWISELTWSAKCLATGFGLSAPHWFYESASFWKRYSIIEQSEKPEEHR